MGDDRESSGSSVPMIIAIIVAIVVLVPCCGGVLLLGGGLAFRARSIPPQDVEVFSVPSTMKTEVAPMPSPPGEPPVAMPPETEKSPPETGTSSKGSEESTESGSATPSAAPE